jgi:hypothetical protein
MRTQFLVWSVTVVGVVLLAGTAEQACADIEDFDDWTLVEDPADPGLSYSVDSSSQVTLTATGPNDGIGIPFNRDIGFKSISGDDVASSQQGWAFDPTSDFTVAVDFDLSFTNAIGGHTIGFGIGEDGDGKNSAGVALASFNGGLLVLGGAGRVNDVNQGFVIDDIDVQSSGRFLVSYQSSSGNITVGVSTDGDNSAEDSGTFSGIQDLWNDDDLLVSFFARGDNGVANFHSGQANAIFSNFQVVAGDPFAVPEPSTLALAILGLLTMGLVAYRRKR